MCTYDDDPIVHLVIFNDGFNMKVEEAYWSGRKARLKVLEYNGEPEGLGPYYCQSINIRDHIDSCD